jgi:nucleoside phosphorylase
MVRETLGSSDYYTVGWIAALPIERAAATALLDERHDEPQGFSQHPSDTNSYTWGRMGEHNIVIASLPAGVYGTTSAATTALSLLSSLPQIRIGLLVGIGGGIARPDEGMDIRLGDVVVSQPDGATGGVVQYDLVKATSGGEREPKGFLNMPPPVLLHALANLQAEHEAEEPMMNEFLSKMLKDKPRMAKAGPGYIHQGFENDQLFKASYEHTRGDHDCRGCDPNGEVQRCARDSTDPKIHYGIIASGNTLVKDAAKRDNLAKHVGEKCLCVEMEAAGLMNHYPCLVIRGICDYADSHKNDRWQRYASATAAAFAKELLSYVPAGDLQKTRRAAELLQSSWYPLPI